MTSRRGRASAGAWAGTRPGQPGAIVWGQRRDISQRRAQEFGILYREFKAEGPTTLFIIRVGNRVTGWLREHIYRTDRSLVDYLRQRG